MADHFSGPRALADPASDITDVYAFPSPQRPGHLVLVLDVFPAAAPTALFSDALRYRIRPWRCPATIPSPRPPLPAFSATPAGLWRPRHWRAGAAGRLLTQRHAAAAGVAPLPWREIAR
jgi:hypothetical protein